MAQRKANILVVEDDPDICEVLAYNLDREGYRVNTAADGDEGLLAARRDSPDLVLLDVMLPGTDGVEVCRKLKSDPLTSGIPVIMVTARGDESDVVLGLGLGADDYIPKPFSAKELMARVRAVLRRGPPREEGDAGDRVVRGGLVIDVQRHEVLVDGSPESFTPTEFRLLHTLASHPGRVFSREQLLSRAVRDGAIVLPRTVDVHVRALRRKLGSHSHRVETVRGFGYRFREG